MRALCVAIACASLSACALGDGDPVAALVPGSLTAALVLPAARDLGDHTLLGPNGERLTITRLRLTVGEVILSAARGGGAAVFDPATPPPGYTLCHSGHCHADDGRLVPYEEIQLELAGGEGGLAAVVSMPVEQELDLLAPAAVPLARFEPSADLGRATLVRGTVDVHHLALTVEQPTGALELALDLDQAWATELDHRTEDGAAVLVPRVSVTLDGLFLEALDARVLSATTTVVLDDLAATTLTRALAGTQPTIALTEQP